MNNLTLFPLLQRIQRRLRLIAWKFKARTEGTNLTTFRLTDTLEVDYPFQSAVGQLLYMRSFELDEVAFLQSVLRPGDIVLDIGANAGIYSLIASRIIGPAGHVYSFEIGPSEIRLFEHNVRKNKLDNVTLLPFAVSNETGQASFALAHDGAMNSLAQNNHPAQAIDRWLTVDTITLSEAARRYGLTRVDFIKMDVEGAEKLVFEGGMDIIKTWKPRYILFETSDLTTSGFGYRSADLIDYLQDNGLSVFVLDGRRMIKLTKNTSVPTNCYNYVATVNPSISANMS